MARDRHLPVLASIYNSCAIDLRGFGIPPNNVTVRSVTGSFSLDRISMANWISAKNTLTGSPGSYVLMSAFWFSMMAWSILGVRFVVREFGDAEVRRS